MQRPCRKILIYASLVLFISPSSLLCLSPSLLPSISFIFLCLFSSQRMCAFFFRCSRFNVESGFTISSVKCDGCLSFRRMLSKTYWLFRKIKGKLSTLLTLAKKKEKRSASVCDSLQKFMQTGDLTNKFFPKYVVYRQRYGVAHGKEPKGFNVLCFYFSPEELYVEWLVV